MRAALITLAFLIPIVLLIWLAVTLGTPTTVVATAGRGGGSGDAATGTQAVALIPKPGERSEFRTLPRGRLADVEQLVLSLPPGTLVVAVPSEARINEAFEVHALLVPDVPAIRDFLVAGHPQRRRAGEALAVTNLYRATLDAGGLAGAQAKDVRWRSQGPVSWSWTLTGARTGEQTLQFAFAVETELDGVREMRRLRALGRETTLTDPLWPKIAAALQGRWWIVAAAAAFVAAGAAMLVLWPRRRKTARAG